MAKRFWLLVAVVVVALFGFVASVGCSDPGPQVIFIGNSNSSPVAAGTTSSHFDYKGLHWSSGSESPAAPAPERPVTRETACGGCAGDCGCGCAAPAMQPVVIVTGGCDKPKPTAPPVVTTPRPVATCNCRPAPTTAPTVISPPGASSTTACYEQKVND